MDVRLRDKLLLEGYFDLKETEQKGICGLRRFLYTVGVVYGLDYTGYSGRYCFADLLDARDALAKWNGYGEIGGNWIKHKGDVEYSNPNYTKQ